MVFTWFLSIRWAEIRTDTRKKMAREEKHWEVRNFNMTLSHKDGKLWLFYVQHVKVNPNKNFIDYFVLQDWQQEKIKEKRNVQKTFIVTLFDFATFRCRILLFASTTFWHHISLWASAPFGCSNCGRLHLEFSKLEERKKWQWYK